MFFIMQKGISFKVQKGTDLAFIYATKFDFMTPRFIDEIFLECVAVKASKCTGAWSTLNNFIFFKI